MVIEPDATPCACSSDDRIGIGEDVSERLDVVPAKFQVIVTRRPKYACKACREGVVQAPAPARLIEAGLPTEALLAHAAVSNYADGLPLFRQADIVVRYGGEEFAVIMPETSRKEGNGVGFVDRARRRVEEAGLAFEDAQGQRRVLTISGGVATLPLQADTWEELFEKADRALYKAKNTGRNRIVGS